MNDFRSGGSDDMGSRPFSFLEQELRRVLRTRGQTDENATDSEKRSDSGLPPFDKVPRDVKVFLDRFVIRQDEAKKVLANAICDHYRHVHAVRKAGTELKAGEFTKPNVLLAGPPGVGKTLLVRRVADLIGVPFVKADATKFSETGYVGGDVEDLVRDLVRQADGDVGLAEAGIVYLDEVDKLASASRSAGVRDVSGRGVQTTLLKLMEDTDVPMRSQTDLAGQVQAMFEAQVRGRSGKDTISTRHILFVMSGAFEGLEEIVRRRIGKSRLGFLAEQGLVEEEPDAAWMSEIETGDFIKFGLEPEFIGRLPVRVCCEPLTVGDLYEVLTRSEVSPLCQVEQSFDAYGIRLDFSEGALREISARAHRQKTGARGLVTVLERLLREAKFELPSSELRCLTVDEAFVQEPVEALAQRMSLEGQRREPLRVAVSAFCAEFKGRTDLDLAFDEGALDAVDRAVAGKAEVAGVWCRDRFQNFEYGLKLIRDRTGQTRFAVGPDVVNDPDGTLTSWVREAMDETD